MRSKREKMGLTQTELAAACKVRSETISRLERGAPASLMSLFKIAPVLKMTLDELVKGKK